MESLVKKEYGLKWWKPRLEDTYRLVRLLQWEEKYMVPVSWILGWLVPIWKQKYSKYQKSGIGVTIPTLVGTKSEEILVQCIKKDFPDDLHIVRWKAAEKTRQYQTTREERRKITWEEPTQAIRQYRKSVQVERNQFRKFSRLMKRRRFRTNPWL
jgi:hypothetical protein